MALIWRECVEEVSYSPPCGFYGSFVGLSEQCLEFGEDEEDLKMVRGTIFPTQVDGVQVGRVRRQEEQMRARVADELAGGLAFVAAEIVGNHDVTGREGRDEALVDPSGEAVAADWPVEHEGGHDAVMTQPGQERQGLPVTVRDMGRQARAAQAPATGPRHVGLDPPSAGQLIPQINCFSRLDIQKYQTLGIKSMLVLLPALPEPRHLRAQLFAGHHGFS